MPHQQDIVDTGYLDESVVHESLEDIQRSFTFNSKSLQRPNNEHLVTYSPGTSSNIATYRKIPTRPFSTRRF